MNTPFYQYRDYMKQRYGQPLYRVPIDFQQGCPHRKKDGTGGCTFCPERGGRSMQTLRQTGVDDQIKEAIRFVRDRYNAEQLMAYFQAFTANFLPESCRMYLDILNRYDFRAVSIGTRPDCLIGNAYEFLNELQEKWDVWIEIGAQSVHDKTLSRINRGHDWKSTENAILKLHENKINVAVHVILGLPDESPEDFIRTAKTFSDLPVDAIKIHNLHVLKDTHLGNEYLNSPFATYGEHEYAEILIEFLRHLRSDLPVIRISTDSLPEEIIEPRWTMNKNQFRSHVIEQMNKRRVRQGDLREKTDSAAFEVQYSPIVTEDGSVTFYNRQFKEHYHTTVGARKEAFHKYILPGRLEERLERGPVRILDVCFGLGYNSLTALNLSEKLQKQISITALETDRSVVHAASENLIPDPSDSFIWKKVLSDLNEKDFYAFGKTTSTVQMIWGDARHTIGADDLKYDLIFLDPFSPPRNSELWSEDFFRKLKEKLKDDGALLTYCAAIPVRSGLMKAGFFVGETEPFGRPRGGTFASLDERLIMMPLQESELNLMEGSRGIPYRDPFGAWTGKEILRDRELNIEEFKRETAAFSG